MATIKDTIDDANTKYMLSLDAGELNAAFAEIKQLLADESKLKIMSETNSENARFLKVKLQLKIYAVEYFCNGYERTDFEKLKDYAEAAERECRQIGFIKTAQLAKSILECAGAFDKIMHDAPALKNRIIDGEGRCVAKEAEDCRQVIAALTKKGEELERLEVAKNIFIDGSFFPDVKDQVITDIRLLVADCEEILKQFLKEQTKDFFRTSAKDITAELNSASYTYYPSENCVERLARTIVLCTPIPEEAELLCWACANGAKIFKIQALAFEGLEESGIKDVFERLAAMNADCVIYGAPHLRSNIKGAFYRAAMQFGKDGRRAFIVADDGTRNVYEQALTYANDGLSALDISFLYLSMPDFKQTVEELERLKMIEESSIEEVRTTMAFMGFAGMNAAVRAHAAGADWKQIARNYSQNNFPAAQKYMLKLARQALFIDGGWGNYHEDVVVNKTKKFDYDDIRVVDPENIKKIMESNCTLFEKCGMLSTYCLLAGSSADEWAALPPEIKSERLTEASKLVMRALGVDIVPVVEVLAELNEKDAGGTCCDGGKRILYKDSCVSDFDWTSRAVCHECFHAFQHSAEVDGWQPWHYTELGVTAGRIEEWRYNFTNYRSIGKGKVVYMIQIVESDARAFETDCLGKSGGRGHILSLIDLN